MKKLLFLFFFLTFQQIVHAQLVPHHFQLIDGRVTWQKVFNEGYVEFDDVLNTIKSHAPFQNFTVSDKKITFYSTPIQIDYNRIPKPFDELKPLYNSHSFTANFVIDYKDGKFRVTVTNMRLQHKISSINRQDFSNKPYILHVPEQVDQPLESIALKNNDFKPIFLMHEAYFYNFTLIDLFKILKNTDLNW